MYNTAAKTTATKPSRPAAPVAAAGAKAASTKPGASLSIGVKEGDGVTFHDLTGLFDAVDKKGGNYFRVSVKEELYIPSGAAIYVRTNDPLSNAKMSVSYGVGNGTTMKFTDVLDLDTASDKSGKPYFKNNAAGDIVIPAGSLLFIRPKTSRR